MQNVVYTETEIEDMLKLPRGRIKSWRRNGFSPAWVQLGRERRYRWADIQEFLNENAVTFKAQRWAQQESEHSIPPWKRHH